MASHTFTVSSSLPISAAFVKLIDLTRVPEWDAGIIAARQVAGDAHELGSRYSVTVTGFDGSPTDVVYELLEVDPPTSFVMEGATDELRARDTLTLVETDDGCTLTYVGVLDLLGDAPPLSDDQLERVFPKIAAVAEAGLTTYLNP